MDKSHIEAVTWRKAIELVQTANRELAAALENLAQPKDRVAYVATYRYGDEVICAPELPTAGRFRRSRSPCGECADCREMEQACGDPLPFGIALSGSFEIYIQWTETIRVAGKSIPVPKHTVPLRLLRTGECFGVFELLDDYYEPEKPVCTGAWRISAGARTIFIISPFLRQPFGDALRKNLPEDIVDQFELTDGSETVEFFKEEQHKFVKFIEKAALQRKSRENQTLRPWTATVLLIPRRWLSEKLRALQSAASSKKALLHLHDVAWAQSRNLRLQNVEAGELAKLLQDEQDPLYFARTIQHVIAISRGDLPGFVPYRDGTAAGPFSTFHQLLFESGLYKHIKGRFPAILEPAHIGVGGANFAYFSLYQPCLVGPVEQFDRAQAARVAQKLKSLQAARPDVLAGPLFRLYLSEELPGNALMKSDFGKQLAIAQKWNVSHEDFFSAFNQGFMHKFVRISRTTQQESEQESVAKLAAVAKS